MIAREFKANGDGGSAKITFSKDIMTQAGFTTGETVMIDIQNGKIIIEKVKQK